VGGSGRIVRPEPELLLNLIAGGAGTCGAEYALRTLWYKFSSSSSSSSVLLDIPECPGEMRSTGMQVAVVNGAEGYSRLLDICRASELVK
jgi:hypothetical protein